MMRREAKRKTDEVKQREDKEKKIKKREEMRYSGKNAKGVIKG